MSLAILFNQFDRDFEYLKQYTASNTNKVLGVIKDSGGTFCRVDINKYHIEVENVRLITYKNTLTNGYNCDKCGFRITKTNDEIRFRHRHKIGKRGFN
jgi:hypothetical protein